MFGAVWHLLRSLGVVKHSIAHIDNSDLFKYSPYKTLSREQKEGIVLIINAILNDDFQNVVIEGGAGTGKTIMTTYLFKLMNTPIEEFNFAGFESADKVLVDLIRKLTQNYTAPKMALVIPMSSFRNTIKYRKSVVSGKSV